MNNAKFAFWYLLSLVALVFMSVATGVIVFQIINQQLVDALNNALPSHEALKVAISAVIISVPIFYWLTYLIRKALKKGDLSADAPIRRWLTYFILFVSAVVGIVWLIMTINSWLSGELTGKFILKTLTVLIITSAIFTYYFYDIKRGKGFKPVIIRIYLIGSLALVAAVFVASFFFVESPQAARDRQHDQAVVNDLNTLDGAINNFYNSNNKKLPAKLSDLANMSTSYYLPASAFVDEVSGKAYDYKVVDAVHYQLCASFKVSSKVLSQNKSYFEDARWQHDVGAKCFNRQVEDWGKNTGGVAPALVAPKN
jgi:hypothetical protein